MISIIIPTLNEEKCLPRLLDSIQEQKLSDYEIIVSDAGSSDDTIKIANEYGCRVVNNQKKKHPSVQRNNGAKIAKGNWLVFVDADTVFKKNFITKSIEEIEKRKLDIAGTYIKFNPNRIIYSIYALSYNIFAYIRQYYSPISVGACIFSKRDIHKKIKGFDISIYLAEDYDYCYRASKIGKFRMIRNDKILYSSRRLEREGKIKGMLKWLKIARYALFNKKIVSKIINYEMGGKK